MASRRHAGGGEAGRGAPVELDDQIRQLAGIEHELKRRQGEILDRLRQLRAWKRLRFGDLAACSPMPEMFLRLRLPDATAGRLLSAMTAARDHGGGGQDWNRRRCACGIICAARHQRLASVRGKAPLDLTWMLGRDGIGGTFRNERKV